jgi:hypothetical protein
MEHRVGYEDQSDTAAAASVDGPATGSDGFVVLGGEEWLRIGAVDRMPPFLVSVVSDSDLWMFVSSRGGLTAGRVDADHALFPYVTDDLLHQCHPHTGPLTLVRLQGGGLWEPLRGPADDDSIERALYKSFAGNQLLFEERNRKLGLVFRARWAGSDKFGFVRTTSLSNEGAAPVALDLVDGLQDLMPAGVNSALQQAYSNLANAYTRAEVDAQTGLGIYALQALIVDQARPVESLKANVVWSTGLASPQVLVCTDQLAAFRRGEAVNAERELKGRRAAWLLASTLTLAPGETRSWDVVADVNLGQVEVEALRQRLATAPDLRAQLSADVRRGTEVLLRNVASADGLQTSNDRRVTAHHFANVLFNNMRGGVFAHGQRVPLADFAQFVHEHDTQVHARHQQALASRAAQEAEAPVEALLAWARAQGDADLLRLAYEYLPLTFSRRHGDPSRPWNKFSIRLRNSDGTRALNYQGNWRDIFQNWEALSASFPAFLESMIAKFVNASTVDGFNPYRLGRDGVDWEAPEPHNPWANIGYWGDHQIVYLLRLLDASARTHPGLLASLLGERIFAYADVPYRLKSAAEIAKDPRETIVFDHAHEARIKERTARLGADGKLVRDSAGAPVRATLAEKLLVPVLAKLGGLVLEGGLWMNTQRPEWNDANNALVGSGLSVVTLGHLRRYLDFCAKLFDERGGTVAAPIELVAWLRETGRILVERQHLLAQDQIGDGERRALLDALAGAFEQYRTKAYEGLTPGATLELREASALLRLAIDYCDRSLRKNRRPDGLYHSYNLLELGPGTARFEPLYEMLEGQVSVLSSGLLDATESLSVLDALFASKLWRPDQGSFLLYPDRTLPGFLEKNRVPPEEVERSPLLGALLAAGDARVISRDVFGCHRFSSELTTPDDLRAVLAKVGREPAFAPLVQAHGEAAVDCFARVFELKRFTGRSGTMYGYEGLGCIYWHMVAKLLLAAQETFERARSSGAPAAQVAALADAYDRIRAGLGFNKSARDYGAFPTDPYSHTPMHAGAQQPGMTGSVKEIILTRFGELGVRVHEGRIELRPALLHASELLSAPADFSFFRPDGAPHTWKLEPGELGFTLCEVPVTYWLGERSRADVEFAGGAIAEFEGARLDAETSRKVFSRTGEVVRIEVELAPAELRRVRA